MKVATTQNSSAAVKIENLDARERKGPGRATARSFFDPFGIPVDRKFYRVVHKAYTLEPYLRAANVILGRNEPPSDHALRPGAAESGDRRVGNLRIRDRIREGCGSKFNGRDR